MKGVGYLLIISGIISCFTGAGIILGIIMMFIGGRMLEMADGQY